MEGGLQELALTLSLENKVFFLKYRHNFVPGGGGSEDHYVKFIKGLVQVLNVSSITYVSKWCTSFSHIYDWAMEANELVMCTAASWLFG